VALLARQLSISEIDDFLQTIMFTLFGNFEPREEHMLLSMFDYALGLEFSAATDLGR
jgi:Ras GTPase-activating-like protein IQGAP2/3